MPRVCIDKPALSDHSNISDLFCKNYVENDGITCINLGVKIVDF